MRVLLVDDEEDLVTTLAERLSLRGIDAHWVLSGQEALKRVEAGCFDIAVLDVVMPGSSGIRLKKQLEQRCPEMKFIFLTGHGSENEYRIGASEAGEEYYLIKPVPLQKLIDKMNEIMACKGECTMDTGWAEIGPGGLAFFGRMSASISHEIKNVLAVINEKAGLLEDICRFAEQGRPPDPVRVKTLAEQIRTQIKRADDTVRNMNQFAHSVDHPVGTVDLSREAVLMAALSHRVASNLGVTLAVDAPAAVPVETRPFFLDNLLWLLLEFSMSHAGGSKTVTLRVSGAGNAASLRCAGLAPLPASGASEFPDARMRRLCALLGAECTLNSQTGEISLALPKTPPR